MMRGRWILIGVVAALAVAQAASSASGAGILFQATFRQLGTGAADRSAMSKMRDVLSVCDFIGSTCPSGGDDRAAIQAAINAAPAGGTLVFPDTAGGNYIVCSGLPFTITKSINLIGESGSTIGANSAIQVCSSASATTDVFLVQPAVSQVVSILFRDMAILPQSGAPGRYAINFDGTNGSINQTIIDHVYFGTFGTANLRAAGNGLSNGTPAASLIWRSYLQGGSAGAISFPNAGDSVKIRDNTIVGSGPAIDVGFFAGASLMEVQGNYILSDGGIHIGNTATAVFIWGNEIQTQGTFTGSNGAVLDIDGTVGSHAVDTVIGANSFQVVNGITANAIRVNYADRTQIFANRFGRGATTSKDISVTANAADTYVGNNSWVSGGPYTTMISDAGTRTVAAFVWPGSLHFVVPNGKFIGSIDDAGTQQALIGIDGTGTGNFYGYHGRAFGAGINGASYLYDGTAGANVGLVVSSALSTTPSTATVTTLWSGASRGTGQATASFDTAGALGGAFLLKDTGNGANNGGALVFAASQGSFGSIKGLIQNGANNTQGDISIATRRASTDGTLTESLRFPAAGGFQITATTQANLGTPSNGTFYYCSDCTIANPCAGGGSGAFAKRLNGVWVCN